jgi:hypothetical protein
MNLCILAKQMYIDDVEIIETLITEVLNDTRLENQLIFKNLKA